MRFAFIVRLAAVSLLLAPATPRARAAATLITYGGDVVLGSFTTMTMELGGTARGTQYDAINVAGKLTFGGTLDVVLINGFNPALGNSFNLFDWGTTAGSFSAVNLPPLGTNLAWNTTQLYTTGVISVVSTLTPIEQWRQFYFGFYTNTGLAADGADGENDGLKNLLEYGLGLNPLLPYSGGLPPVGKITVGPDQFLTLTFTRPLSATDITYLVEVNGDLVTAWLPGSWYSSTGDIPTNANTTQVSRVSGGGSETITVRDNTPMSAGRRFLRLTITHP